MNAVTRVLAGLDLVDLLVEEDLGSVINLKA